MSLETLTASLSMARRVQGELLGMVRTIGGLPQMEAAVSAMAREVVSNSAIEGVDLSLESVRASMMLRLSVAYGGHLPSGTRPVDPIVGVLAEAVQGWRDPLSLERLFQWHKAIFPGGFSPQLGPIRTGELRGDAPMVVATPSKTQDKPDLIHFEAPGRERLEAEMGAFLSWFNNRPSGLDGLIRAGIAHLWFVTIHPFEDGNGRIARTITDLALAQDEQSGLRFFSLSAQILRNKDGYYGALEQAQRGSLDVTPWLGWFLEQVQGSAQNGMYEVHRVLARNRFWAKADGLQLNERQIAGLKRALSPFNTEDVLSNRFYRKITDTNRTTAARDLSELVELGLLEPFGAGRSASYRVPLEQFRPESIQGLVKGLEADPS